VNIAAIQEALAIQIEEQTSLRTATFLGQGTNPPMVVVPVPDIEYDSVHANGEHMVAWTAIAIAGRPVDRAATEMLARMLSTDDVAGHVSIKVALEADPTLDGNVSTLRVETAEPIIVTISGVDYLGAEFAIDIRS